MAHRHLGEHLQAETSPAVEPALDLAWCQAVPRACVRSASWVTDESGKLMSPSPCTGGRLELPHAVWASRSPLYPCLVSLRHTPNSCGCNQ